jgi:hypothetical protein
MKMLKDCIPTYNIETKYVQLLSLIYLFVVKFQPCPHGMARPRVADGGTASRYGG